MNHLSLQMDFWCFGKIANVDVWLMHLECPFGRQSQPHNGSDNTIKDKYLRGRRGKIDYRRCENDQTSYLSFPAYLGLVELSHR